MTVKYRVNLYKYKYTHENICNSILKCDLKNMAQFAYNKPMVQHSTPHNKYKTKIVWLAN